MSLLGKICNGCQRVLVTGQPAARKSDLVDHGALIGEGEPTVVMQGVPAARMTDRFMCPSTIDTPHRGGLIQIGAARVIIGGKPAARDGDLTMCLGEHANNDGLSASPGGGGGGGDDASGCAAAWRKLQEEAAAIIAPAGDDHRERNHIINGAYAQLFKSSGGRFAWAGLAAYASKQVGCAMDHCDRVMAADDPGFPGHPPGPQHAMASHLKEKLGEGNRDLFLDIYPMHRFYQLYGGDRFAECAGEREPPIPAAALDGFDALQRYEQSKDPADLREHVRAIAFHEQVDVLQEKIYNDPYTRFILDANEGNVVGADLPPGLVKPFGSQPADVTMTSECHDDTPGKQKTIPFKTDRPGNLYDVDQRMEWIIDEVGGYYFDNMGGSEHLSDLDTLEQRGKAHGGRYP